MSQHDRGSRTTAGSSPEPEERIRELLEGAGRRPEVPRRDLAMIQTAARAEWQELVAARRRRGFAFRRAAALAVATSLILAVAAGWWWTQRTSADSTPIATVALLDGGVRVQGPPDRQDERRREPAVGDDLLPGTTLATEGRGNPGMATLTLANGESVRLDAATTVRLATRSRLELDRGTLYVDSGSSPAAEDRLEVVTAWGSVREIGTQFEIRVVEGDDVPLRVRVREGSVSVAADTGSHSVAMGQELRLHRDGGVSRRPVASHGPLWEWTLAAAPGIDVDGRTLHSFLEWACRETGWRLRYADEALARSAAAEIILSGNIEDLTPDEAVSVMVQASGLDSRVEDGTLWITRNPSDK